jgi:hypothetical protein
MSHAHMRPLWTLPAALSILPLLAGGCTSTKTRRLARFDAGRAAPVLRPAPESGVYKVKYAGPAGHDLHAVGGTGRIVGEGEPIGFTTADDGTIVAVAGDDQIPLDRLPPAARYCVWSFKEKRATQFTREVGKATDTVGQAAAVAGGVALVGGLVVGNLYLDALAEEIRRDRCEERDRHRRKSRGYRWVGAESAPQQPAARQPMKQPEQKQQAR